MTLTWIQGSLLHRQHEDLLALREDVQILADSVEQGTAEEGSTEDGLAPARRYPGRRPRLQRVRMLQAAPAEEEQAQKELQDAKTSAQKAVNEAREVRSKLSIEENIRKAGEKAKIDEAENAWQKWFWAALGAGLVTIAVRAWLRRRG